MIYRTAPDGTLRSFPDGTSEEEIQQQFSVIANEQGEKTKSALAETQDALKGMEKMLIMA